MHSKLALGPYKIFTFSHLDPLTQGFEYGGEEACSYEAQDEGDDGLGGTAT